MLVAETPVQFLDSGPLVDGELELVSPQKRWVDDVVAACQHPLTRRDAPGETHVTRQRLLDFLEASPLGRRVADP